MPPPVSEGSKGLSPVALWVIVGIIVIVLLVSISLLLIKHQKSRQRQTDKTAPFQIEMVRLNFFSGLKTALADWFGELWRRLRSLRPRRRQREPAPAATLVSVRAVYRKLLHWAARHGVSRAVSQTPLEHLAALRLKFPERQTDLDTIIRSYLTARYSTRAVSPEEFNAARDAWQRIKSQRPAG